MPINIHNCTHTPTTVSLGNFNGSTFQPNTMPSGHRIYTATNCRVNLNPSLNNGAGVSGITSLDPQPSTTGDTYFLPFNTNNICSMVLPAPAAAVCHSFLTTNLSGCMVYVDRVQGAPGSIVVYHANNQANAPGGNLGGLQPTLQLPACTQTLNQLYVQARADYAGLPAPLNLWPLGNVDKPAYNFGAMLEVNRKLGQNRTTVEFTGGTIVFGRIVAGQWQLFWATYGSCEYDRPKNAPKRWFSAKHRNPTASTNPNYRILGSARFV